MTDGDGEKQQTMEIAARAMPGRSVQPRFTEGGELQYALSLLRIWQKEQDEVPKWGRAERDGWLRDFWKSPGNEILQGAVSSMQKKIKSLRWDITGGPLLRRRYNALLHQAEGGAGWRTFVSKVVEDYLTQDRGAFIEIIHQTRSPTSAIVGLAHLDAGRCWPTGKTDKPVIYEDSKGNIHELLETQVIHLSDMASPDEMKNNRGFCAVSRVLKAASIVRAFSHYKYEKLSTRPLPGLAIAAGVTQQQIRDALVSADEEEVSKHGRLMFRNIPIVAALSPDHEVSLEMIEFRSVPDGFDGEAEITLFVYLVALAFGVDAREFWPATMTGATKADALVQAQKARGKGPGDIMTQIEDVLNWKVLPTSCRFEFDFVDDEEDRLKAEIMDTRADVLRKLWLADPTTLTGIITTEQALELAIEWGLLPARFREAAEGGEEQTVPDIEEKALARLDKILQRKWL